MSTPPQVIESKHRGWPKGKPRKPIQIDAQNGQPAQLEPIPAKQTRRSLKSPQIREAVIAHALLGASNVQIAKDLEINRATVANILGAAEIEQHVLVGRSRAVQMIPRALDTFEYRLSKNDANVAGMILKGTQVLQNQPITVNQNNIQANTWITMRQQRSNEETELAKDEHKPSE